MSRKRDNAYDRVDRFLRNNLDDADYAEYSEALELLFVPEPEMKREALNEETIRWEYEKTEKNLRTVALTEYGWFDAGVRFAEKHHGIGGGDE